jgi:putative phage-type endonuclease
MDVVNSIDALSENADQEPDQSDDKSLSSDVGNSLSSDEDNSLSSDEDNSLSSDEDNSLSSNEDNIMSEDDLIYASATIYELTHEYIQSHISDMHEPSFHTRMCDEISNLLFSDWSQIGICNETQYEDIRTHCNVICNDYFDLHISYSPRRSQPNTRILQHHSKERYLTTIDRLLSIEQPEQRTAEWYEFRHNLISASSMGKILGTDASRNRIIYEKCKPAYNAVSRGSGAINVNSPMHWGQKYEPVTCALYEQLFSTKVSEFGCIQHKVHPFIGASPDGIITKPNCPRYGRMLEIKNIVNREITGIPLKDYWIQMQIQMECCDLDECDFMETRFKEYENETAFWGDETRTHRGVMLYFVERVSIGHDQGMRRRSNTYPCAEDIENSPTGYALAQQYSGVPRYEYMPLDIPLEKESVDKWIDTMRLKLRRSWSLYTAIYWYVDQYSCVLVERNRAWFKEVLPLIENTWKTIEQERESGCEHRAPAKKSTATTSSGLEVVRLGDDKELRNFPLQKGVCLIKLDT